MTYYDPHPAHVLVGDAFFESRAKIVRKLFDEDDYCKRWDLAHELLGKYTRREILALVHRWGIHLVMDDRADLQKVCESTANFIANFTEPTYGFGESSAVRDTPMDVLVNPASRLPTSDVWGTELYPKW